MALRDGAVAVIDALGFKGIWNRVPDPRVVIAKLEELRHTVEFFEHPRLGPDGNEYPAPVRSRFFSDGIVITATVEDVRPVRQITTLGEAVDAVARAALLTIVAGAGRAPTTYGETPPLLYRGCIAAGKILAKGDFFVGSAIDEAAEWSQKADAAIIWLLPSARSALGAAAPEHLVFEWDVPLKGHSSPLSALVLNPLGRSDSPSHWRETMENLDRTIMGSFDEKLPVEVEIKKQNTRRALDAARAATQRWFESQGDQ